MTKGYLFCFFGSHEYITCLDGKTKKCLNCYKTKKVKKMRECPYCKEQLKINKKDSAIYECPKGHGKWIEN